MATSSFEHEFDVGDLVVHRRPSDDARDTFSNEPWSVIDVVYSSNCGGVRYVVRQSCAGTPIEMFEHELESWEVFNARVRLTTS